VLLVAGCTLQVEMFSVTANETGHESEEALNDFLDIEQSLFEQLGLHFRFAALNDKNLCLHWRILWTQSDFVKFRNTRK